MKIIVVGAGSFGTWSALKLQQTGCHVTLVDAWGPGNSRASSGGETRVIRTVYGADAFYVEMAAQAIDEWEHLQKSIDLELMRLTGSLWLCGEDHSYIRSAEPALRKLGFELQEFTRAEAGKRWPQINFEDLDAVFLEPTSGFLRARAACFALTELFVKRGGHFFQAAIEPPAVDSACNHIELKTGERLEADQIVVAAGPWAHQLLPRDLKDLIQVSKQEVYYFGTPAGSVDFEVDNLPIWLELNEPIYYGIPSVDRRGFKVARDERGKDFDPDLDPRVVTDQLVQESTNYLSRRFPTLTNPKLVESRICQYSNTPDGHFILDRLEPSGIVVAGGGSGHGFKMGPVVGGLVSQLVLQEKYREEFRLSRFDKLEHKTTQFDHS